jgi:RluA family pseudouridine synthase
MPNPISVLFDDSGVLVVDKPAGLLSVPSGRGDEPTLVEMLKSQGIRAEPVHRLDREVSGALICARDAATRAALEDQFRERELKKIYWALARGILRQSNGELKYPLLEERGNVRVSAIGKPSLTRYRTLCIFEGASELEVDLVTGRYNQIRVHFAHAGYPLIGERKYARGRDDPFRFGRVALHAWRVAFAHPNTRAMVEVEAALPSDLLALRERAAVR